MSPSPSRSSRWRAAATALVATLVVPAVIATTAPIARAAPVTFGGARQAAVPRVVTPGIAGGERIQINTAPYQVHIRAVLGPADPSGKTPYGLCGGTIVDARHIVTAAHCAFNEAAGNVPIPAGAYTVYAGVSQYSPATFAGTPSAGDALQVKAVAGVSVHPLYPNTPSSTALAAFLDDVAVLTLASPLRLGGPTAQAIPLAPVGAGPSAGKPAIVSGYGLQVGHATSANGGLYRIGETILDGAPPSLAGPFNAIVTVATSGNGSFCQGDSGGPLVVDGALAGVVSTNAANCAPNEVNTYTTVAAGEIRAFIDNAIAGVNNPLTSAPRGGQDVSLSAPRTPLTAGDVVTCGAGTWSGGPALTYEFRDGATGAGLQGGPSATYKLPSTDVGRTISCRGIATNAGGQGHTVLTQPTPPVVAAPSAPKPRRLSAKIVLGAKKARRRHTVRLRVKVRNPTAGVAKSVKTCVKLSPKLTVRSRGGGKLSHHHRRLCFKTKRLKSHRSTVKRFSVRVKSNAKKGRASVTVTATASKFKARKARRTIVIKRH